MQFRAISSGPASVETSPVIRAFSASVGTGAAPGISAVDLKKKICKKDGQALHNVLYNMEIAFFVKYRFTEITKESNREVFWPIK
uniref:FERM domain-containing protein n=1 Tax=Ascaris lumbricoides TaxID=6252 RepID=A0A0M3HW23_ASCLU